MIKHIIKQAKIIHNETLTVEYYQKEEDGAEALVHIPHDRPVHQDLRNSFNLLKPHLAILTGCLKPADAVNPEYIKDFHITGFSIKDEGCVIKGYRSLENGTVVLNTPFTEFEGEHVYMLIGEVQNALEKCKDEVLQYLFEGKRAPQQQPELPFGENGKEEEELVQK